jgi:hypothetical protein
MRITLSVLPSILQCHIVIDSSLKGEPGTLEANEALKRLFGVLFEAQMRPSGHGLTIIKEEDRCANLP